jgi:hypothetical protein
MSEMRTLALGRRKQISYEEFMARHDKEHSTADFGFLRFDFEGSPISASQLAAGPLRLPPLSPLMLELKHHPLFRLLAAAAEENCPDAFTTILYLWLCRLGARPPEGALTEPRGKAGRPRERLTQIIYKKWTEIGCPPLSHHQLAFAIYGPEFTKAGSAGRKKMVDRCRRAVQRRQAQLRPNAESIRS